MASTYSTSETGHIKNIESFNDLIQFCKRFDTAYNPSPNHLTLPQLENLLEEAKTAQNQVNESWSLLTVKVNQRQKSFEKLRPLASRIYLSLTAATNDKKIIADLRTFVNKIQGKPATPKTNDNQEGQETATIRSNSQQSYDKLIEHFENMILLLENVPQYTPNETELNLTGLNTFLEELETVDKDVLLAYVPYKRALTERDIKLYNQENNLIDVALLVKKYIKSVFGGNSLEYHEISNIKFRRFRR